MRHVRQFVQERGNAKSRQRDFFAFFLLLPGQHTGQGPSPRYLCPRLQVFQPPRLGFATPFSSRYSTFVAIHQVVPPASFTPPRLSASSFFTGACTDIAPASRARLYVASTSAT